MEMNSKQSEPMMEEEGTPLDEAISMLQGYIASPKTFTPETGTNLLNLLTEIKGGVDGDDDGDMEHGSEGNPSLMIAIGKARKGGGYK